MFTSLICGSENSYHKPLPLRWRIVYQTLFFKCTDTCLPHIKGLEQWSQWFTQTFYSELWGTINAIEGYSIDTSHTRYTNDVTLLVGLHTWKCSSGKTQHSKKIGLEYAPYRIHALYLQWTKIANSCIVYCKDIKVNSFGNGCKKSIYEKRG